MVRPLWRCLLVLGTLLLAAASSPCALAADAPTSAQAAAEKPKLVTTYAISLYGEPKYSADFKHFDYVDPNAPKGGTVHLSSLGSYDSFNTFALRGTSALNILVLPRVYDSLMTQSFDERSTQYGLLAEQVTYPSDYAWIEYKMRPNAKWHDGKPITPQDVVFTFNTMRDHASPLYRSIFEQADKAEVTGPRTVKITFKAAGNRRNLFLVGPMAILPEHYWKGRDFEAPMVTPPLGSGPYEVASFKLGNSYTLKRVANYWGKDLPVNVGKYNFDEIVTDFYRDSVADFQSFKAGYTDFRNEISPKDWATGYVWPAVKHGDVIRDSVKSNQGFLYEGFVYNTRRPVFQDPKLREALSYAFDFAWMNKNLFYDFFIRTRSYFGNDELAARRLPSPAEIKLLESFRNQIPPRVFTTEYNPPDTDGSDAGLRNNLRIASKMLSDAGYKIVNGKLVSPITHQPVTFEILMSDPAEELSSSHWADNLKMLGITATLRTLDLPQYIKMTQAYDYDVLFSLIPVGANPGAEQRNIWGSKAADTKGAANYAGVKSPVVDFLLDKMVSAQTRDDLLASVHALDRVLSWSFYSVPHYSADAAKLGYWDKFGRPKINQAFGLGFDEWWIDPKKAAALQAAQGTAQ